MPGSRWPPSPEPSADRYTDASTARGAGLVRAKTGTLNTVIALSGYVVDADGRLLVFSFIGNGLTPGADNRTALDRTAAVLAVLRLPLTPACRLTGAAFRSPVSELKAERQAPVI